MSYMRVLTSVMLKLSFFQILNSALPVLACIGTCIDMCMDMCTDTHADMCTGHAADTRAMA